jgi:hypothetical protein
MSEIEKPFSLDQLKIVTDTDSAGAERGGAAPAPALPCLSSNICTKDEKLNILTGAHKRTAFMVAFEIECLVKEFGIERIGFFTLTFKDHVTDLGEAQKRFRSLRAHVIAKRYQRARRGLHCIQTPGIPFGQFCVAGGMVILAADLPEISLWPSRIDAGQIQRGRNFALRRQIYFQARHATAGGRQGRAGGAFHWLQAGDAPGVLPVFVEHGQRLAVAAQDGDVCRTA